MSATTLTPEQANPWEVTARTIVYSAIGAALYGLRTRRNFAALALAMSGVFLLINVRWAGDPAGLFWAVLNGLLFVGYIALGIKGVLAGPDKQSAFRRASPAVTEKL